MSSKNGKDEALLPKWVVVVEFRCYTSSKEIHYRVCERMAYVKKDLKTALKTMKADRAHWTAEANGHNWWWVVWEENLTDNQVRNYKFYSPELKEIEQQPEDYSVVALGVK